MDQSILWKELVPIVIACAVWARYRWGHTITVHCDNMGAVTVVNSGYSRESPIMHWLRCLFFIRGACSLLGPRISSHFTHCIYRGHKIRGPIPCHKVMQISCTPRWEIQLISDQPFQEA